MKTKIETTPEGHVKLVYWDPVYDEQRIRMFSVRSPYGYVREWVRGEWVQVFDLLSDRGNAIECRPEELESVIRREWSKLRKFWRQGGIV